MKHKNPTNYIQSIETLRKGALTASNFSEDIFNNSLNFLKINGLPTHKHEDWLYTPIHNFLPENIDLTHNKSVTTLQKSEDFFNIVLIDGHIDLDLSNLPSQGLTVTSLSQAVDKNLISTFCQVNNGHFEHLNLCTLEQGLLINIEAKVKIQKPIKIHHIKSDQKNYIAPRLLITAEALSEATFWEHFNSSNNDTFENNVTKVIVNEGACINYVKDNSRIIHATQVSLFDATVESNANLNCFFYTSSSRMVRNNIKVDLVGENATTDVSGLYTSTEDEHCDEFVTINHLKSHTFSHQLFKGILSGTSRGVFTGKVVVHRDAQKVDSSQLNKNILLSNKAHIYSRPQLEVYADDVKCAHGSTTGQLSQDELFYLESRGISSSRAYHMLCEGFAKDALNKVKNPKILAYLENDLVETLKVL